MRLAAPTKIVEVELGQPLTSLGSLAAERGRYRARLVHKALSRPEHA
jgi:hypothetical protein